jgi:hypothetical protein
VQFSSPHGSWTFVLVFSKFIRSQGSIAGYSQEHDKHTMKKNITEANRTCDEAMQCLFQVVYYIGKELIQFNHFIGSCALLVSVKANITKSMYHDENLCAEVLFCISSKESVGSG